MDDGRGIMERLKRFLSGGGGDREEAAPPGPGGEPTEDCEEIDDISCEEAVSRVYEFLDQEVDEEERERIRCHILKCERCYPFFNWERVFLETVKEKGSAPRPNPELKVKVRELLDAAS